MQVSIETTSGLERRMTIVVPSETFEQQISERLKATAQRARLAGFRPGKVPVKEIRRRFGKSVRQEVAGELMQSTFFEAIERESMSPAGSPSLDVLRMEPGEDFEFAATFEVYPPVDLAPLTSLAAGQHGCFAVRQLPSVGDFIAGKLDWRNQALSLIDLPEQPLAASQ